MASTLAQHWLTHLRMTKKQLNKLIQHWNKVLASEDLKPLDSSAGMLNDKGSGAIKTSDRGIKRQAAFADICNRRALLDAPLSVLERKVVQLYADGLGTRSIALQLKIGRQKIRTVIKTVISRVACTPIDLADLVKQCDPAFVIALQTCLDLSDPQFDDLPLYMQNILQPPLSTWEQQMTLNASD